MTPARGSTSQMGADQEREYWRLLRAVDALGNRIPCRNPEYTADADWLSDDGTVAQQTAAVLCIGCPALFMCRKYSRTWAEAGGTWAAETSLDRRNLRALRRRGKPP
ncbi:hypothetical protein ACFVWT_04120 [Arthrobacter sp. NPDC058288]|uniref:hypothetical protein n=1 Tax=Arthrobacter sp. NPDC058288 TaxID=3346424 RepID=UPI0036E34F43